VDSIIPAGALHAGKLVASASPQVNQAAAQFLYNTATGMLAFDADGTGEGLRSIWFRWWGCQG